MLLQNNVSIFVIQLCNLTNLTVLICVWDLRKPKFLKKKHLFFAIHKVLYRGNRDFIVRFLIIIC
jgi:hypothetical protein